MGSLFGWLGGLSAMNSALFWGGLGAVSIPIIIHLLNRRRYRVLRWAAIDFLLQAQKANRKRVRVEHLLVLLLRCLAVFLIVAMVARPVSTRGALSILPGARDQVERLLVVDDSASTMEREADKSAFDEEKRLTKELLADLVRERPGDLVTIVRGSRAHRPDLIRSEAKSSRTEDLNRRIDDWQPTHSRFLLDECLREVLATERGGEKEKSTALRRFVYVLTDFRRTDWMATPNEKEAKELAEKGNASSRLQLAARTIKAAGQDVTFMIVDSGHPDTTNVGVIDLQPQEKLVVTGIPQKLLAKVKNWGKAPVRDLKMELAVGVDADARERLPLPTLPLLNPGEVRDVEVSYTFSEAGRTAVSVLVQTDRMPADDRRDVALEVVKAVRVLIVDGKPTDDPFESQTYYLERALQPPGEVKSGVEVVTIPLERLADEQDLASYHAIVLCDVDHFPAQRLPALERYVQEGGGLAIFLGDEVDAGAYERELWTRKVRETDKDGKPIEHVVEGGGLLPCRLGEMMGPFQESPKLAVPTLDHPLLRVFQGEKNPFLSRVRSRRHYGLKLDPAKDAATRVVGRWEDPQSTPAIVEKAFGEGRVVLLNTTASRAWTDWPREISFPITSQELVRYLAPDSRRGANFVVGAVQTRAINPGVYEPKAKLLLPDEKTPHQLLAARDTRVGESSGASTDALVFTFPEATSAGVYSLELTPRAPGVPPRREAHVATLDANEGDLEKADAPQVTKILEGEGVKVQIATAAGHSLLTLTEGERNELWRTAAWLLLFILAFEGFASFWAAHHGSSAPADEVNAAANRPWTPSTASSAAAPIGLPRAGESSSTSPAADRPTALPTVGGRT